MQVMVRFWALVYLDLVKLSLTFDWVTQHLANLYSSSILFALLAR